MVPCLWYKSAWLSFWKLLGLALDLLQLVCAEFLLCFSLLDARCVSSLSSARASSSVLCLSAGSSRKLDNELLVCFEQRVLLYSWSSVQNFMVVRIVPHTVYSPMYTDQFNLDIKFHGRLEHRVLQYSLSSLQNCMVVGSIPHTVDSHLYTDKFNMGNELHGDLEH